MAAIRHAQRAMMGQPRSARVAARRDERCLRSGRTAPFTRRTVSCMGPDHTRAPGGHDIRSWHTAARLACPDRPTATNANMPTTMEGINILMDNGVMYAPGKASNAGGVATSGLEMTQNYMGTHWTVEEVDAKLQGIMKHIHETCLAAAKEYGSPGNYLAGANIAGFIKVAKAMQAQGVI